MLSTNAIVSSGLTCLKIKFNDTCQTLEDMIIKLAIISIMYHNAQKCNVKFDKET